MTKNEVIYVFYKTELMTRSILMSYRMNDLLNKMKATETDEDREIWNRYGEDRINNPELY